MLTGTEARSARVYAGFDLAEAAQRVGVSRRYLRGVERDGCGYYLAHRLSRLYGCSPSVFLPRPRRRRDASEERTPRSSSGGHVGRA